MVSRVNGQLTIEAAGVFSDGFKTNVFPAVTLTGNIHSGIMAGKLNGALKVLPTVEVRDVRFSVAAPVQKCHLPIPAQTPNGVL